MREMKDSGIEWIGEIPSGWDIGKVGYFFEVQLGKMLQPSQENHEDTFEYYLCAANVGKNTFKPSPLKRMWFNPNEYSVFDVRNGDLLVVEGGDVASCAIVNIDNPRVFIQNALHRVRSKDNSDIRILKYWLWNAKGIGHIDLICNKATIAHFSKEKFISLPYVVIPKLEQSKIADYLDRKCAEIDAVIDKTKATIEEYKKLKQSVITEAVTKGIRGERPMKDSGIEWIGEIPAEWTTSYLKYAMRWKSIKGQPDATVLSLYRDYGVIPKDSRDDNHNVTSLDTTGYKVVSVGDFVINKMKAWQGSMAVSEYAGIISPAYHICEITDTTLNKKYLHHLLRNYLYLPEYARLSTGMRIGQWDLGYDDFKNLPFIIPHRKEQDEIVEFIERGLSKYDNLIAKKTALLDEMESYKKSVIYEYVTGKKEVR